MFVVVLNVFLSFLGVFRICCSVFGRSRRVLGGTSSGPGALTRVAELQ